jgi:CHAD domain-containing protein
MLIRATEKPDKWIAGVSPADRLLEVAARSLESRLAAVLHYLPLAVAQGPAQADCVHMLRVWSRRSAAALNLYAVLLPVRRVAWLKKQLRRIRRAATEARDCDVLATRFANGHDNASAEHWRDEVRKLRLKAQAPIVKIHQRLAHKDRFERRIAKLLLAVRPPAKKKVRSQDMSFGVWARRRFAAPVEGFWEAAPAADCSETELHNFRIRAKKLRYMMELLAGAFSPSFSDEPYALVVTLQDKLGEINDLALAQVRLRADTSCTTAQQQYLVTLLRGQQARLGQALDDFRAWWTPQVQDKLRRSFAAAIADR